MPDASAAEYWRSGAGLAHITPAGKACPEGEEFGPFLASLVGEEQSVLEVGCGPGRLAGLFDPTLYYGVDICPEAIRQAKAAVPFHLFRPIDDEAPFPRLGVTLFHTVLLHVPDDALAAMIDRLTSPRVLVSEILGRHWRRPGDPPVFNREEEDYISAFSPRYRMRRRWDCIYPHYRDTKLSILEFTW